MKTIANLKVNVILTYEGQCPQDFYDIQVSIPLALPPMATGRDMEADVLEQIVTAVAGDHASGEPNGEGGKLNELVKISLCYALPDIVDFDLSEAIEALTFYGAKYYFQPNQRGTVETELMERIPGLAAQTEPFRFGLFQTEPFAA